MIVTGAELRSLSSPRNLSHAASLSANVSHLLMNYNSDSINERPLGAERCHGTSACMLADPERSYCRGSPPALKGTSTSMCSTSPRTLRSGGTYRPSGFTTQPTAARRRSVPLRISISSLLLPAPFRASQKATVTRSNELSFSHRRALDPNDQQHRPQPQWGGGK